MGKSAILKKIHNAAKNYQRYLAGKTFMYVYEGKSIEVVFKNSSFLHLTGVNTKLRAKEFYKHAKTKNGLKVQEFFFDKNHPYDLAEKKTDHLEDLYRITNMEVLITEDVVTFTANYKIGITDLQFILLCGENRDKHGKLIDDCLVPYSFRIEQIGNEKFGELYEVDFIFCKQTNESINVALKIILAIIYTYKKTGVWCKIPFGQPVWYFMPDQIKKQGEKILPEKMFMLREWLKILWQLQCLVC